MDLKEGKKYVITVTTSFVGEFVGYDGADGTPQLAQFKQDGRTDKGNVPTRIVRVDNIVSAELTKLPG